MLENTNKIKLKTGRREAQFEMKALLPALTSLTSQQLHRLCNRHNTHFMIYHGKKFEAYTSRERMLKFRKYS
jgi:hypothetical protein